MSGKIDGLIPEFRPYAEELVRLAGEAGLRPQITSTLRTRAQQTKLYENYRAGRSALPAAPPGFSAHEYGYAMDMIVTPYEYLAELGRIWTEAGGVWGKASDPVHFEYPGFSPPAQVVEAFDWLQTVVDIASGIFTPWWTTVLEWIMPMGSDPALKGLSTLMGSTSKTPSTPKRKKEISVGLQRSGSGSPFASEQTVLGYLGMSRTEAVRAGTQERLRG